MLLLQTHIFKEKNQVKSLMKKLQKVWLLIGFEAVVWILGLLFLILIHTPGKTHLTICPLANLGIDFCPGCGLGNSISYLFRGEFVFSFHSHPLGIFAFVVITTRIISIIKDNWRKYA